MQSNNGIAEGYKLTSVGVIPEEWEVNTLGDFVEKIVGGGTPRRDKHEFWEGNIFWATVKDLSSFNPFFTEETITDLGLKNSSSNLIPKGTLITATRMALGKAVRYEVNVAINQDLKAIFPKKSLDTKFLFYWFEKNSNLINELGNGSTVKGISLDTLRNIKFFKIPPPEQTAIANCISTWDKAIITTNALITQKALRKKWLMQQLLTGKKRLKGFEKEIWREFYLGDLFSERNQTGYPHLQLLSIGQDGVYPQSESDKRDISNQDKSKYKRICPGDIGYNTMRMWQGRSALSYLEGIVSPAYTILRPNKNTNSTFFAHLFTTPKLINLFFRNSQGLVEDTLNCKYKDFAIIKIHLPDEKEQIAIRNVLQTADKEIQLLKAKLERLKEQKKGLMQVLLTGKKRLKEFNKAPVREQLNIDEQLK